MAVLFRFGDSGLMAARTISGGTVVTITGTLKFGGRVAFTDRS